MRSRPNPSAFTLIELLLVLAILAIIVAIVAPKLRGFTVGRATNNTASNILAMTHYARTQAVVEGRTYRLNYDPNAKSLYLTYENAGAITAPGSDFGSPLTIADGISLDTDIPKQTDGQYIEFHATGRTDPAIIKLTDSFGSTIAVQCASPTEAFRILEGSEVPK